MQGAIVLPIKQSKEKVNRNRVAIITSAFAVPIPTIISVASVTRRALQPRSRNRMIFYTLHHIPFQTRESIVVAAV